MSSVTFDVAVGGDGSTVTDDNNATTGLREGGWKTRFVPCFTQQVAVANYIVTKAGEASTSASAASSSATAAAASYDSFDDRYLGAKTSDPTLDNDGNALLTGAIYWNSSTSVMKVWSGSAWVSYNPAISYLALSGGTMTGAITFAAGQTISGYLPTTGGTMTGAITFNAGQTISGYLPLAGGTMTGLLTTKELALTKTAPSISAGVLTLDCSLSNTFAVSLNASITSFTVSNIPSSGSYYEFNLEFTADGTARAVTWTFSSVAVKWPGGTAPTLTSTNGKKDIFVFYTYDAGTTWLGFVAGQNL